VRSALGLRVGIPIASVRWLVEELASDPRDVDVEIEAEPPGLRLAGTFETMQTRLRGSAVVYVDRVAISADELRLELRLERVSLRVLSEKKTHLSALVRSRALDLRNPGDLVAELPDMPPVIAQAHDNLVVLDLMREPRLRRNRLAFHAVGVLSGFVTVHGLETDPSHLDVLMRAFPRGRGAAADAVEEHLLEPALRRAKGLLQPAGTDGESPWRRMLGGLRERLAGPVGAGA
jgi:hypothetical protein